MIVSMKIVKMYDFGKRGSKIGKETAGSNIEGRRGTILGKKLKSVLRGNREVGNWRIKKKKG